MHSSNKLLVIPSFEIAVEVILLCCITLGETASINVTLSSHNIENGTSMNLTAAFDPTVGSALLSDVSCRYIQPGGSGYIAITRYNTVQKKIMVHTSLSSSQRSRINIMSSGNPMILTISNIIFADEKTSFYCHLIYYDSLGNFLSMESDNQILENVYSLPTVNDASSIQQSTTLTEGIAANLACVASGRPQSNITWQYNSAIINAIGSNVYEGSPLITTTSVLTINYPTRSMDGQQITCVIVHQFSSTMNRITTLKVNALGETASINVTLSSRSIQNGTSMNLTVAFDPTVGSVFLSDVSCRYKKPGQSGYTAITRYNPVVKKIEFHTSLSSSQRSRMNITSSGNPMILTISNIIFADEKTTFYCHLIYFDNLGNFLSMDSNNQILENVYSLPTVIDVRSIQQSTTLIEGIAANLECVATGRPQSNITWQYNSTIISANSSNVYEGSPLITTTSVLTINYPTRSMDGQQITCSISHQFSSTMNKTTTLIFGYEPDQVRLTASSLKPTTGSSVTLTCTARASPSASFRFISINGSYEIVQDSTSATYTISPLDYKKYNNYVANYGCIAYNSFGNSSMQTVALDIQVPPWITFSFTPNTVNEGQNATAECKVNAANPAPNITIMDNINQDIPHVGGQATMSHITRNQAGRYTCMATNGIGGVVTATANLTVYYAPEQVQLRASSLTPTNGSSITLTCSAQAIPPPTGYIFVKGSSQTTLQNSSSPTYTIGAIDYRNFVKYNAMFACVAYNLVGGGSSSNVTLNIQVGPKISISPGMTVVEGENVVLYCNVTAANPMPNITWSHPSSGVISNTNGMIIIPSIKRNQHAVYSCIASNGVGPAVIRTTSLVVNYGPEIQQNSTEYEQCKGTNARIVCSAVGRPPPDVLLQLNNNILIRNSSSLTYDFQVDADAKFGSYVCVSNNTVGTVTVTTIIKSKPSGNVTNIKLSVTGNSIKVAWDLPECSANIKEIKVQYRKKGQVTWPLQVNTASPSDKEITIKGLENGVEYEVRVVAVEIGGREHKMEAPGAVKIDSKTERASSTLSSSDIAISTIVPLFTVIVIALLIWIFKLKRQVAALSSKNNALSNQTNQAGYMDLKLHDVNTDVQPYATITNPGALAYEQIPEVRTQYMELNTLQEGNQPYAKLSKDYEEIGKV